MALPDGPRQLLASALSACVFVALFFGATLVWWLALGLAASVYLALLLIVRRRTPLDEVMLDARISAADIQAAGAALRDAADRLTRAAEPVPEGDRQAIEHMAETLMAIRDKVLADPQDYRSTRRFIASYLPHMVQSVEAYGDLARVSRGKQADRLARLGAQIRGYAPILDQIDQACIENDFTALEAEVDALGTQLNRRY